MPGDGAVPRRMYEVVVCSDADAIIIQYHCTSGSRPDAEGSGCVSAHATCHVLTYGLERQ
jgi:hypothetical protein